MELRIAVCHALLRIALPLLLLTAVVLRQNLFSAVYLVLLFVGPFLPQPSAKSFLTGSVGIYCKLLIFVGVVICGNHVVFQVVLLTNYQEYNQSFDYCTPIGRLYNLIGWHRLDQLSVFGILRLLCLDFLLLIYVGSVYIVCQNTYSSYLKEEKLKEEQAKENEAKQLERMQRRERRATEGGISLYSIGISPMAKTAEKAEKKRLRKQKAVEMAKFLSEVIFVVFLWAAAILHPSLSSALYFIAFLTIATWLATNRKLGFVYNRFKIILSIYIGLHFTSLFIYQMEYVRSYLAPDTLEARLLGLTEYVASNCTTSREVAYQSLDGTVYAHPFVLIGLYFLCASLVRHQFLKRDRVVETISGPNETADQVCPPAAPVPSGQGRVSVASSQVKSDLIPPQTGHSSRSSYDRKARATSNVNEAFIECLNDADDELPPEAVSPAGEEAMLMNDMTPASSSSEWTPQLLPSNSRPSKNYQTLADRTSLGPGAKSGLEMDSNGSVIWKNEDGMSGGMSSPRVGPSASRPGTPTTRPGTPAEKADKPRRFVVLLHLLNLIKKSSYAGTLIVMMTWSITYHSWLTFVLLLWSCIIWMMPNSRQACLKSAFALVMYALFLLLGQYIFSLNLTEAELPEKGDVSLNQIGFKKYYSQSYIPLAVKILYTLMFWITLRQHMEEKEKEKHNQIADSVLQPFNIGLGTATPGTRRPDMRRHMSLATTEPLHPSASIIWLSIKVRRLLVKYWIWMVATMLMVISLGGQRVVIYRIVYMFIFLSFVLMFQISYRLWRKFMYTFWLLVIVYSMAVLIAIYTYQFENFGEYWERILFVSPQLQRDIGLELYGKDPWVLFKELLTPTFFIIITIIQVHFLHKDFMELSKYEDIAATPVPSEETRLTFSGPASETTAHSSAAASAPPPPPSQPPPSSSRKSTEVRINMDKSALSASQSSNKSSSHASELSSKTPLEVQASQTSAQTAGSSSAFGTPVGQESPTKSSIGKMRRKESEKPVPVSIADIKAAASDIKHRAHSLWDEAKPRFHQLYEVFWRFLEIHTIKAVFICALIVAVIDISVVNFTFVILTVIALPFPRFEKVAIHIFGAWSASLILLKMLYQLSIADDVAWETNCSSVRGSDANYTYEPFNATIDNRNYIGFEKVDNVFTYIAEYLLIVLVLTLNSVVFIRQQVHRYRHGETAPPPGVIFEGTTRRDADHDLLQTIKFLFNYGFFKFGLEFTLFAIILLIGYRKDLLSVLFSLWLLLLSLLRRQTVQRLWPYFTVFMTTLIPVQYLLALGIPTGLCTEYPWFAWIDPELRNWLFLPDFQIKPSVLFICYDFAVLLLASRQWIVFKTEDEVHAENCGGGSNAETCLEPGFKHKEEVPDFFTFGKTTLDHVKSLLFSCFYWITLAIVFLTATGRRNLFGLGYILGCFVFLWNGSEFYLKPMRVIRKTWNCLIAYNVAVILVKTIIGMIGCVESTALFGSGWCWVTQLLGIACQRKIVRVDEYHIQFQDMTGNDCSLTENASGLLWDGVCFCFLMIQKRIFGSHYFSYLVNDIQAQQVLASRGAELIHEIQAKEVMEQEQQEKEGMEKIKMKMDRIRANQQKAFVEKADRKSHRQAVRSGDYYMFEDPESEIIDLDEKQRRSLIDDPEGTELKRIADAKGLTAFCSKLVKGDFEELEPRRDSGEFIDVGESSKDSAIVSADRTVHDPDESQRTAATSLPTSSTQTQDYSSAFGIDQHPFSSHHSEKAVVEHQEDAKSGKEDGQDGDDDEGDDGSDKKKEQSFGERIVKWFRIMCLFFRSCVISATAKLNHVSRDYRYVSRRLAVEKKALKMLFEIEKAEGIQYDSLWKKETLEKISKASVPKIKREDSTSSLKKQAKPIGNSIEDLCPHTDDPTDAITDGGDSGTTFLSSNAFIRFFRSLFYTVVSQSEVVCYTMVIINQIINASLLSLPLPIMVFLWGCLSVPRPSKTFWISLITYTEAIVVAKYIFGFRLWPWPDYSNWRPNVFGTGKGGISESHMDLVLLLFLFFHRFMLKSLGLWDLDHTEERKQLIESLEEENQRESCWSEEVMAAKKKASSKPSGLRRRKIRPKPSSKVKAIKESGEASSKESRESRQSQEITGMEIVLYEDKTRTGSRGSKDGDLEAEAKDRTDSISANNSSTFSKTQDEEGSDEESEFEFNAIYSLIMLPTVLKESFILCVSPIVFFYNRLLHPAFRIAHDVYAICFLCDFINFFIVVFGYNSFGSSDASITTYFEENRVPIPFLVMLLAQFCAIIIDRALYLRKNIQGRLVFHVMLVLVVHIWLFFALPSITEKSFTDVTAPKFWYAFKCIYLLLSALQIKSGYPTCILGNTFTKKYSYFNLYLFKGYMAVPFLYDMRLIMDWIWTDTSLELDEWSIMEDIFRNLFQRKCELNFQEQFPEPRGHARRHIGKYLLGGVYLVMIIGAIWFPLVVFALGGQVGTPNLPQDVTIEIEVSGFEPIAKISATKVNETSLTFAEYLTLKSNNQKAASFLENYDAPDTALVKLNGNSTPLWSISPPSQKTLINLLNSETRMDIKITWRIVRKKEKKQQEMDLTVYKSYDRPIDLDLRHDLIGVLNGTITEQITVRNIFPNYIRVPEKGEPPVINQLQVNRSDETTNYRDIKISLKQGPFEGETTVVQWWEVADICEDKKKDPLAFLRTDCDKLLIVLFNEPIFPSALQFISGYGILGLYTTFVFVMSRMIRGFFDDVSFKVIYTQMPCVDKVLQLCLDIYLVRESREFSLEEDLYAKLIFLYRSPETLIKWTKPKEEEKEGEKG